MRSMCSIRLLRNPGNQSKDRRWLELSGPVSFRPDNDENVKIGSRIILFSSECTSIRPSEEGR